MHTKTTPYDQSKIAARLSKDDKNLLNLIKGYYSGLGAITGNTYPFEIGVCTAALLDAQEDLKEYPKAINQL
jgi:hypothetical protein